MTRHTSLILLALLTPILGWAQPAGMLQLDDVRARIGFFGAFDMNRHEADFRALPGVPSCCPQFESGDGTGFAGGIIYEMPLAAPLLLGFRGSWMQHNGTLIRDEVTTGISGNATIPVTFEHSMAGEFASGGIEALLQVRPFADLWLIGGARLGYLYTGRYDQRESITQPSVGATFVDGRKSRNESSGEIESLSGIQAWVGGGLSWEMGGAEAGTIIAPEIFYLYPLTGFSSDVEWRSATLRLGIAMKFTGEPIYQPKPILVDTLYRRDTTTTVVAWGSPEQVVFIDARNSSTEREDEATVYRTITIAERYRREVPSPTAALTAQLRVVGLNSAGAEIDRPVIRTEEVLASEYRPLLNYVFFDSNSSELPGRYNRLAPQATGPFQPTKLYRERTLDIYHHLLNIVGRRLSDFPQATITIVGCNNNTGAEGGNTRLSMARAETVRDYLRDVWKIAEGRMTLQSRGLPEKPSNMTGETRPDGLQENRRAEIYSDTWEIVEPLLTTDTIRTTSIDAVRFYPTASSRAGIASMSLEVVGTGGIVKRYASATGALDGAIDMRIADDRELIAALSGEHVVTLRVADRSGATTEATGSFTVDQVTLRKKRVERIADRTIDRYSLILFDFDAATLGTANRRIVDFVTGRLAPQASVAVTGHTDRTGSDEYNLRLSARRATATAESLAHPNTTAEGLGEQGLLFDNELPEGRFYCRTVNIVVETPVGE